MEPLDTASRETRNEGRLMFSNAMLSNRAVSDLIAQEVRYGALGRADEWYVLCEPTLTDRCDGTYSAGIRLSAIDIAQSTRSNEDTPSAATTVHESDGTTSTNVMSGNVRDRGHSDIPIAVIDADSQKVILAQDLVARFADIISPIEKDPLRQYMFALYQAGVFYDEWHDAWRHVNHKFGPPEETDRANGNLPPGLRFAYYFSTLLPYIIPLDIQ